MFVCEHDCRIADPNLGVADLPSGPGMRISSVAPNARL